MDKVNMCITCKTKFIADVNIIILVKIYRWNADTLWIKTKIQFYIIKILTS